MDDADPEHLVAYNQNAEINQNAKISSSTAGNSLEAPPGFPYPIFNASFAGKHIQLLPSASSGQDEEFLSKEGLELWNAHFAPVESTGKVTQVPIEWCKFIIFALMTVDNFDWAKSLLASQLWTYIIEGSASNQTLPFVIPEKCQSEQILCCKNSVEEPEVSSNVACTPQALHRSSTPPLPPASTSLAHTQRKRKDKAPMVETEAAAKDCTEEMLHQPKKKKEAKVAAKGPSKKAVFKP
nr:uncharacterized protein LOC120967422 [Aegilops tauschii subsp. strangulata]